MKEKIFVGIVKVTRKSNRVMAIALTLEKEVI